MRLWKARPASKILIVDPDPLLREQLKSLLATEVDALSEVATGPEALAEIEHFSPQVIIYHALNSGRGLDALRELRSTGSQAAVILISAETEVRDRVRFLESGGSDFLAIPFIPEELRARVRVHLRSQKWLEELKAENVRLQQLTDTDPVSELFNMRSIYQRLEHELERGARFGHCTSAVMLDVDFFKRVNDSSGHLFGTYALNQIGKIIRNTIRRVDIAARYGGDEFLILLPETILQDAAAFAERLRLAIERHPFKESQQAMRLTASLGVATSPPEASGVSAKTLIRLADLALYRAKDDGRNCVRLDSESAAGRFRTGA